MTRLFNSVGSNEALTCDFNVTKLQDETSVLCGQFCIYFIVQRLFNDDLEFAELLNEIFSENVVENEHSVQDFLALLDSS